MDRLKGLGTSLVGAAGNMVEKSGWGDSLSKLKENYLNKVYDIGHRRFIVKKLIAEGGFGFVFLVRDMNSDRQYALKRILVQDKDRIPAIKNELHIMKALARQPHVVSLEDSRTIDNRTDLEVLLLMEYCSTSLLDALVSGHFRNEQDIYEVFAQICSAVALLHGSHPAISHRDLKVENVLRGEDGRWKLCDFGSASTVSYLLTNDRDRSVAEEDINRNTTMMYRAPEMVDLYRRQPINEKVDIWALGCILFKLAYNVDAFDSGLGIMNARYTFPEFRRTSPPFEDFIRFLLNPDPTARPDIQQVQEKLATLRGVPAPKQPSRPVQSQPVQSRPVANPNISLAQTTARPSSAPTQKPVADLVDWGDDTSSPSSSSPSPSHKPANPTAPAAGLRSSAPLPHQPSTSSKPAASNSLFDALGDWEQEGHKVSATSAKPITPPSLAPKSNNTPPPSIKPNTTPQPSQRVAHKPAPPASSKQADLPDLLDFSDPPKHPLPPSSLGKYAGPPLATPSQYYSPQQPRAHNPYFNPAAPSNLSYVSPPFTHHQPPPPQQNPLSQFTLAKPQSSGGLDDFDPLAPKPTTPTTPPPSSSSSSPRPHLPPPKASQKPAHSRPAGNDPDSLIHF